MSSDFVDDVYRPPAATILADTQPDTLPLASRLQRLGAAIVENMIFAAVAILVLLVAGSFGAVDFDAVDEDSIFYVILAAAGLVYLLINAYLLSTNGQTVGKYFFKIKIVGLDGALVPVIKLAVLRYVPIWILSALPLIGGFIGLLDVLFIFREDRRCLHDLIAGTKVVRTTP